MRSWLLPLLAAAAVASPGPGAWGAGVDLSPPANSLGSMDRQGHLRLFQDLGEVSLGGLRVPLRLDFSSGRPGERSEMGWPGWRCGLLEASATPVQRLEWLRVELLCAKTMLLRRDALNTITYSSADGSWKAALEAGRVRLWREDGWELRFERGKIARLRDDRGRTFLWERDGEGRLLAIRTEGAGEGAAGEPGEALLTLGRDPGTGQVQSLSAGASEYRFAFDENGGLSRIDWDLSSGQPRHLEAAQAPGELRLSLDGEPERRFRWEEESGHLTEDALGAYRVLEKLDGVAGRRRLVLRRPDGAVLLRESDAASGIEMRSREDGALIVERRLRTPESAGALARVDLVDQRGGGAATVLLRNHYGPAGRLLRREWRGDPREHRGFGAARIEPALLPDRELAYPDERLDPAAAAALPLFEIIYEYDARGQHAATRIGEALVLRRERDPAGRLVLEEMPGRFRTATRYLPGGGREVSVTPLDREGGDPAHRPSHGEARLLLLGAAYDAAGHPVEERFLDGRRLVHERDGAGRVLLTRAFAPDGVTLLETLAVVHRAGGLRRYETLRDERTGKTGGQEVFVAPDGAEIRRVRADSPPAWVSAGATAPPGP